MGITEVVLHLPRIYREFRRLKRSIRERRPAAAILIDFPDLHLALAREFHRLGIPVIYFVSPQLWAWKKHRIHQVKKYIARMLVIFPFEEPFYLSHGVDASFVGHPLADEPLPSIAREEFASRHALDLAARWIGLLPGSRIKEIRANLPEMLRAARMLAAGTQENPQDNSPAKDSSTPANPGSAEPQTSPLLNPAPSGARRLQFVLPMAATLTAAQRAELRALIQLHAPALDLRLTDDARSTLFHARASIVASGTATVEAALMGNPFIVIYRVSPLTYSIAKRAVKVPHIAMVNLIAEKRLVPELIQHDFTARNIVQSLEPLIEETAARREMLAGLRTLRQKLTAATGFGIADLGMADGTAREAPGGAACKMAGGADNETAGGAASAETGAAASMDDAAADSAARETAGKLRRGTAIGRVAGITLDVVADRIAHLR
jgi:lipid-A-disaccharide synthase